MSKPDLDAICRRALELWDKNGQVDCLLEEMAELQKEIIKNRKGRDNVEAIAEEVADVEIMLHQLKVIHGVLEKVEEYKTYKLTRLQQRM